ncbi:hypothetical protein DXG03_001635 [Asterophora parasitica]|uniref:Uncharacterized protein n=1 Tax=Asterophora parasitica TaxID=117018 RepID=A0A9P7FXP2_9AGAR|nr:hypothetical protein DXG03_001635 [Asterophora parasitica]
MQEDQTGNWDEPAFGGTIKLGKWIHACNIKQTDDMLENFTSMLVTEEVNDVLTPAKSILESLLKTPDNVSPEDSPLVKWVRDAKKDLRKTLVPYAGGLTISERAQIAHWFELNVSKDKKTCQNWIGFVLIVHVHIVFIASHLKDDPKYHDLDEKGHLKEAWAVLLSCTLPLDWMDIDVDYECIEKLEEQRFKDSVHAGIAGNQQWGLDAGSHQNSWNPYGGLPYNWKKGD